MKTILVDAVDTFVIEGEGIFKEMHELLETYPNRKIILTNANDEQIMEFWLDDLPYDLFTLKQQPTKADPMYYETMLKQFDLDVNDVVYFEHNINSVISAQSVWIKTFHYDPEARDLDALKAFIDISL